MKKIILGLLCFLCFVPIIKAEELYEASIGDVKYTTISEAITAAKDGDTIKLLNNVTVNVTVPEEKNLTINLNNYNIGKKLENYGSLTIIGPGELLSLSNECGMVGCTISNYGNMILRNVTIERKNSYNYSMLDNEGENLVLDNITYTGNGNYIFLYNHKNSNVIVNSGNYTLNRESFVQNNGQITIEGGSFTEGEIGENSGIFTINNGTFSSDNSTLFENCSDAVLNLLGGTYSGEIIAVNSCFETSTTNATINIKGGSYVTTESLFKNYILTKDSTINIYGGIMTSTTDSYVLSELFDNNNNSINIYGGTIEAKNSLGVRNVVGNKIVFGTNDGIVKSDDLKIYVNNGTLVGEENSGYEFYDGKIILNSKIEANMIIPEGYKIQYDDNKNNTYTAYLVKIEADSPVIENPITPEEPVTPETPEEPVIPEEPKKDVEQTVENPPTGLYFSVGIATTLLISIIGLIISKKKNYFSKI